MSSMIARRASEAIDIVARTVNAPWIASLHAQ
jgi:hypothetical protein